MTWYFSLKVVIDTTLNQALEALKSAWFWALETLKIQVKVQAWNWTFFASSLRPWKPWHFCGLDLDLIHPHDCSDIVLAGYLVLTRFTTYQTKATAFRNFFFWQEKMIQCVWSRAKVKMVNFWKASLCSAFVIGSRTFVPWCKIDTKCSFFSAKKVAKNALPTGKLFFATCYPIHKKCEMSIT